MHTTVPVLEYRLLCFVKLGQVYVAAIDRKCNFYTVHENLATNVQPRDINRLQWPSGNKDVTASCSGVAQTPERC